MTPPTDSLSHSRDGEPANDLSHNHSERAGGSVAVPRSVLAWPAWLRVAAVLPVVLALWLALFWANAGAALW